jgi:hypothetical protein
VLDRQFISEMCFYSTALCHARCLTFFTSVFPSGPIVGIPPSPTPPVPPAPPPTPEQAAPPSSNFRFELERK